MIRCLDTSIEKRTIREASKGCLIEALPEHWPRIFVRENQVTDISGEPRPYRKIRPQRRARVMGDEALDDSLTDSQNPTSIDRYADLLSEVEALG